jgi:splicing factor 3B subunit 3
VGCEDQTLRIFSLDPEHTLESLSLQALSAPPASICIVEDSGSTAQSAFIIHIGLQNGVLLQTVLDTSTKQLVDAKSRSVLYFFRIFFIDFPFIISFVGLRPIRLSRIKLGGATAMLTLSSRPWMNYTYNKQTRFSPLIYDELQYVCGFSHNLCPDGFAGIVGSELRCVVYPISLSTPFMPISLVEFSDF